MATTLVFDGVRLQVDDAVGRAVLELGLIVYRLRQPETVAVPARIDGREVIWTGVLAPGTTLGTIIDPDDPDDPIAGSREAAHRIGERAAALASPLPTGPSTDVEAWFGGL